MTRGYVVEIVNVLNHQGEDGLYYPQVFVQQKNGRKTVWSAEVFRKTFRPMGKKGRPKTVIEHLRDSEL